MIHEYAFDVKLWAAIRVKAESKAEAIATIYECIDSVDCTAGLWPDGSVITFEASANREDELVLYELDGEWVD